MLPKFLSWSMPGPTVAEKYHAGEISKDDYDKWRYNYPQYDETQITATVPSQELSDAIVKAFKKNLKD